MIHSTVEPTTHAANFGGQDSRTDRSVQPYRRGVLGPLSNHSCRICHLSTHCSPETEPGSSLVTRCNREIYFLHHSKNILSFSLMLSLIDSQTETGLPADWEVRHSNSKNLPYYFNSKSRESRWDPLEGTDTETLKTYMAQNHTAPQIRERMAQLRRVRSGLPIFSSSTTKVGSQLAGESHRSQGR